MTIDFLKRIWKMEIMTGVDHLYQFQCSTCWSQHHVHSSTQEPLPKHTWFAKRCVSIVKRWKRRIQQYSPFSSSWEMKQSPFTYHQFGKWEYWGKGRRYGSSIVWVVDPTICWCYICDVLHRIGENVFLTLYM